MEEVGRVGPEVGDWQVAELDGRTRAMRVCHARSDESAAVESQRHTDAACDSLDLSWKTQRIANDKQMRIATLTPANFASPSRKNETSVSTFHPTYFLLYYKRPYQNTIQ